jgi:hypothetical protein
MAQPHGRRDRSQDGRSSGERLSGSELRVGVNDLCSTVPLGFSLRGSVNTVLTVGTTTSAKPCSTAAARTIATWWRCVDAIQSSRRCRHLAILQNRC